MRKALVKHIDDVLQIAGSIAVVAGLAMWSIQIALIAAGIMLIIFGELIAKERAKHVTQ